MFVRFVCACVLFCSCRLGMTISLDWFVFCICCVAGWYFVSGSVLEDSSQTEISEKKSQGWFSERGLKARYQGELSQTVLNDKLLKESGQREIFLKDIYQSDISNKVIKQSSQRDLRESVHLPLRLFPLNLPINFSCLFRYIICWSLASSVSSYPMGLLVMCM